MQALFQGNKGGFSEIRNLFQQFDGNKNANEKQLARSEVQNWKSGSMASSFVWDNIPEEIFSTFAEFSVQG